MIVYYVIWLYIMKYMYDCIFCNMSVCSVIWLYVLMFRVIKISQMIFLRIYLNCFERFNRNKNNSKTLLSVSWCTFVNKTTDHSLLETNVQWVLYLLSVFSSERWVQPQSVYFLLWMVMICLWHSLQLWQTIR